MFTRLHRLEDLHDLGKEKKSKHLSASLSSCNKSKTNKSSSYQSLVLQHRTSYYISKQSTQHPLKVHSQSLQCSSSGALSLCTSLHQSLQEDFLKTGVGNRNSLSPNDTLEASCTEPALPRLLVKESTSQRKMRDWERQKEAGRRRKEGEGATQPTFWSGRDWDACLWIGGVFN